MAGIAMLNKKLDIDLEISVTFTYRRTANLLISDNLSG